ncbi:MAG: RNA-binding protein [Sphingobacteriales bacterium]|nr:MAG: RNA-binding protein [Sphingobacteriales bacterium]
MDSIDLKEMFELYGTVVMAKVVTDPATRKSKGFGFVEYSSAAEAKEVMELLNGKMVDRKILVVKPAEK